MQTFECSICHEKFEAYVDEVDYYSPICPTCSGVEAEAE